MRKWIFLSLLFLGVGCTTQSQPIVIFPNGFVLTVEIADSYSERSRGLSGRAGLASGKGMLFLHDDRDIQRYWMKGMNFPIDIIWIDENEVVGFVENAQPEDPPITIYSSPQPVDKVLEVSGGFVVKNALEIGDILDIEVADQ